MEEARKTVKIDSSPRLSRGREHFALDLLIYPCFPRLPRLCFIETSIREIKHEIATLPPDGH